MRHYIICIFLFTAIGTQAQQVNPVPDYVFRNQMSVGRNAVTDTAAYMSIGPRYGANKGLMPPIVSDTAAITGVKRNGLLIFSVQRNNFQYWDSINSRWTSVTANVDTTIISTRAWRKKGDDSLGAVIATRTDTTLLSTRAWRQKGLDSLAAIELNIADTATMLNPYTRGSGTVNYVPKFTTTRAFGNSQIFDDGTNVGVGTASPWAKLSLGFSSSLSFGSSSFPFSVSRSASGNLVTTFSDGYDNSNARVDFTMRSGSANTTTPLSIVGTGRIGIGTTSPVYKLDVRGGGIFYDAGGTGGTTTYTYLNGQGGLELKGVTNENIRYEGTHLTFQNGSTERMRLTAAGRLLVGTTTEGTNTVDIAGTLRSTQGANFATSSGNVGIGTTNPAAKLEVNQNMTVALAISHIGASSSTITTSLSGDFGSLAFQNTNNTNNNYNSILWLNDESTISSSIHGVYTSHTAGAQSGALLFATRNNGSYNERVRIASDGEVWIGYTTDQGAFTLQVNGVSLSNEGLRTGAPTGGTAATWKLGTVATVSPTSPNRTIEVEIGGTTYYIHAKTTND